MTNGEITEYHTCDTCEHTFCVPVDPNFKKWEFACKRKSSEVNSGGGLTRCGLWKEKKLN